jgi:hypothetical protein
MRSVFLHMAALILGGAVLCGTAQARQSPLVEPPRSELSVDGTGSVERVKSSIVAAASSLGWVVRADEPGRMRLVYNKQGRHEVTIDCVYDAKGYQLKYVQSMNMNYGRDDAGEMIHPNYNRWINNLIKTIGQIHGSTALR